MDRNSIGQLQQYMVPGRMILIMTVAIAQFWRGQCARLIRMISIDICTTARTLDGHECDKTIDTHSLDE